MNRGDLQGLATTRVREAEALLAVGEWSGAYYLAGYVIECAFKACIARELREHEFPDKERVNRSYSHNLDALAKVAGLGEALTEEMNNDPTFEAFWLVVKDWRTESRYQIKTEAEARELLTSIADHDHGVLRWIHHYW